MIPIRLSISGFLSYRSQAVVDFSQFDLACISGPNGAGKSSLLDAITWALFGQARKRDDSVIHLLESCADVSLIFAYEGNYYQVHRIKPRDKTMILEFQILQAAEDDAASKEVRDLVVDGVWKPLTERTLRETEARIVQTLRMDYETFTNASFFLQGKADQFTQQRPGDRKRILGSILGLEIWEDYRERASDFRRRVESKISEVDGQLKEIAVELGEEQPRLKRLKDLETNLKRQQKQREAQEAITKTARQAAAQLAHQRGLVDVLARQLEANTNQLEQVIKRRDMRKEEEQSFSARLERAQVIEAEYAEWKSLRDELEVTEQTASKFREFEKRREEPRSLIQEARARLEQELEGLLGARKQVEQDDAEAADIQRQYEMSTNELALVEAQLEQRSQFDANMQDLRQEQADLRAENASLKPEMEKLKERIARLEESDRPECPLCGQVLIADDRKALIERLNLDGQQMGDKHRANRARLQELDVKINELEANIGAFVQSEVAARQWTARIAQLAAQKEGLQKRQAEWLEIGSVRLAEVERVLKQEDFASEARQRLMVIDRELLEIGYDAARHDSIRKAEQAARSSEEEMRALEQARASLAPLRREIADLDKQTEEIYKESDRMKADYEQAAAALAAVQSQAPDLDEAERILLDMQEEENRLREEMGAAQQEVAVLEIQKERRKAFDAEREQLAHQVGLYRQLERALGKDGVPALLIEQALPQIEMKSNETLDRLSGGQMSVHFVTQAKYKDKNREDMKETLEIVISDSTGKRDYEMFSGGEAFRVNFAIRLALSEVLAQRAGARLQTLVIDEGFGSQDNLGRQRLVEAINMVREDFAKILVITHIDELKDAFPNRIEVEKTEKGSLVKVI